MCEKKEAVISEVSSSVSESPVLFRDSDTVIDFELIYLILLRQSPGNTPEILTRAKNDRLAPDPNRHSRESLPAVDKTITLSAGLPAHWPSKYEMHSGRQAGGNLD